MPIARLERTIISITGENVEEFLGGLITNSLKDGITFAALLTPQGKIIADFFVHKMGDKLLLETPNKFGKILLIRLKMYKLRAAIEIEDVTEEHFLYALWEGKGDVGKPDPRHPKLGQRFLTSNLLSTEHSAQDYDVHRLSLGIPDSTWDFDSQDFFPADTNMDLLGGVDYKKGCFIGQEVVSRMHRKSSVRKRILGLKVTTELDPNGGMKIFKGSREIGWVLHINGLMGMGLVRLNRLGVDGEILIHRKPATILEPSHDT